MKQLKKAGSLCLLAVLLLMLAGCGQKAPATKEQFTKTLSSHGFEVTDQSDLLPDGSEFSSMCLAQPSDFDLESYADADNTLFSGAYQIEFYEFDSASSCAANYSELDQAMTATYEGSSNYATSQKQAANYARRSVKTSANFYTVGRIDNTMVIAISPKTESDNVLSILDELGYK